MFILTVQVTVLTLLSTAPFTVLRLYVTIFVQPTVLRLHMSAQTNILRLQMSLLTLQVPVFSFKFASALAILLSTLSILAFLSWCGGELSLKVSNRLRYTSSCVEQTPYNFFWKMSEWITLTVYYLALCLSLSLPLSLSVSTSLVSVNKSWSRAPLQIPITNHIWSIYFSVICHILHLRHCRLYRSPTISDMNLNKIKNFIVLTFPVARTQNKITNTA
jgi:hypothetical protein